MSKQKDDRYFTEEDGDFQKFDKKKKKSRKDKKRNGNPHRDKRRSKSQ